MMAQLLLHAELLAVTYRGPAARLPLPAPQASAVRRMMPTAAPPLLLAVGLAVAQAAPPLPGRLPTPPAGWRSWNQLGGGISQEIMMAMAKGLTDKSRTVGGKPTSLLELGFDRLGMDDNWQACGLGVNGSFHDAQGVPLWNLQEFPNVTRMNAAIHALGLNSDWYINNCICSEKRGSATLVPVGFSLAGNAKALVELGFDGTKVDGCGPDRNVSRFAELVDEAAAKAVAGGAVARPITIEDCNDSPTWDRGLDPGNQSVSYPIGGCAVSGGGFYRIGGDSECNNAASHLPLSRRV